MKRTKAAAPTLTDGIADAVEVNLHKVIQYRRNEWRTRARSDAEFGKRKFCKTLQTIAIAFSIHAWDFRRELDVALQETGAGDNPEIIRLIHRMAVALGQGMPDLKKCPTRLRQLGRAK